MRPCINAILMRTVELRGHILESSHRDMNLMHGGCEILRRSSSSSADSNLSEPDARDRHGEPRQTTLVTYGVGVSKSSLVARNQVKYRLMRSQKNYIAAYLLLAGSSQYTFQNGHNKQPQNALKRRAKRVRLLIMVSEIGRKKMRRSGKSMNPGCGPHYPRCSVGLRSRSET